MRNGDIGRGIDKEGDPSRFEPHLHPCTSPRGGQAESAKLAGYIARWFSLTCTKNLTCLGIADGLRSIVGHDHSIITRPLNS